MNYVIKMIALVFALGVLVLQGCQTSSPKSSGSFLQDLNESAGRVGSTNASDKVVCNIATSSKGKWKQQPNNYVDEAKRRGLSCGVPKNKEELKILSNNNIFKNQSNSRICFYSTIIKNKKIVWSEAKLYIEEAKRRNLDCGVKDKKTITASKQNQKNNIDIQKVACALMPSGHCRFLEKSNEELCEYIIGYKRGVTSYDNYSGSFNEAKRRGLTCGTSNVSNLPITVKSYSWLSEYNDIRNVTVKVGDEVFKTYAAAKFDRNGKKINYKSRVILFNELCNVNSQIIIGNRNGRFKVVCPSGYEANGTLIALGSGKGSIGKGRDSLGNKVQYNFHDRLKGKISKNEMITALNNLEKSKKEKFISDKSTKYANKLKNRIKVDNQKPSLNVFTEQKGPNVIISGSVTDNTEVAELLVNGKAQKIKPNGTFETSFYIPRTGKQKLIYKPR